jgi:hypothetical protein
VKCPECKTDKLFLIDGMCQECRNFALETLPKRKKGNYAGRRSSREQRYDTVNLRNECAFLMMSHDLKPYKFARIIGLTSSAFYRWFNGEFTWPRQPAFNKKVKQALKNLDQFRLDEEAMS